MGSDGERGFNMDGQDAQDGDWGPSTGSTGSTSSPQANSPQAGSGQGGGCVAICDGVKYTPPKIATRFPLGG
jgi:hypothetical protein